MGPYFGSVLAGLSRHASMHMVPPEDMQKVCIMSSRWLCGRFWCIAVQACMRSSPPAAQASEMHPPGSKLTSVCRPGAARVAAGVGTPPGGAAGLSLTPAAAASSCKQQWQLIAD